MKKQKTTTKPKKKWSTFQKINRKYNTPVSIAYVGFGAGVIGTTIDTAAFLSTGVPVPVGSMALKAAGLAFGGYGVKKAHDMKNQQHRRRTLAIRRAFKQRKMASRKK